MGRRRRLIKSEYETWDFHIDGWDHHYFFSVRTAKGRDNYYEESGHFDLRCSVTYPDDKKGRKAYLHFIPKRDLDLLLGDDRAYDSSPEALGYLTTRTTPIDAYVSIPWKSHTHILQLLDSGTFTFVQLHGIREKRRGVSVSSVMFAKDDPDPVESEATESIQTASL